MTSHPYWQKPAIEQRRDPKEVWDDLVQFLTAADRQRELCGRITIHHATS